MARYEPVLFPYHLPTNIRTSVARTTLNSSKGFMDKAPLIDNFKNIGHENFPMMKDFRVLMECRYLQKLMQLSHDSKKEACRLSGLSRTRLFELLKKHKIGA